MHPDVARHIPEIRELCREFGVERLEIFGSAVTEGFDPDRSDVDFLVTYPSGYDSGPWASCYVDLEERLAAILGRDVDLVINKPQSNRFFARDIDRTRCPVYAVGASGGASVERCEQAGRRPVHQRTLKLLEDIRLWCADAAEHVAGIDLGSLQEDDCCRDAIAHVLVQIGRGCDRLREADPGIAIRVDNLASLVLLKDQLAYGSGVDVSPEALWHANRVSLPPLQARVETLIEELEREGDNVPI